MKTTKETKTQWTNTQWINYSYAPMTDEEKKEKIEEYSRSSEEIIFFRDEGFGDGNGVFYSRDRDEIYFSVNIDDDRNFISSDEFSDETLENIIEVMSEILKNRRENAK